MNQKYMLKGSGRRGGHKYREWNKPLKEFARKLSPYFHGIIASASYSLNNYILEGINNKIKLIKQMGYGYRDTNYFFSLKIKVAFT